MKESLKRVWKAGWTNFKRNSYLSLGTTGVMTLVLILFSSLMALNFISLKIVGSLHEKVDVTAYFKSDATEEEILKRLDERTDIRVYVLEPVRKALFAPPQDFSRQGKLTIVKPN